MSKIIDLSKVRYKGRGGGKKGAVTREGRKHSWRVIAFVIQEEEEEEEEEKRRKVGATKFRRLLTPFQHELFPMCR